MNKKIVCFLLCGILSLVFCSCKNANVNRTNNSNTADNSSFCDTAIDFFGNDNSGDEVFYSDIYSTLADVYSLKNGASFVLAEFQAVEGSFLSYPIGSDYHLLVKFKIIEDYYHKLSAGTIIHIPFKNLYNSDEVKIDMAVLSEFLQSNKLSMMFIGRITENNKFYENTNKNSVREFKLVSSGGDVSTENYIPIENGIVNLNRVPYFLEENDCAPVTTPQQNIWQFSTFVSDGMPLEHLENNIEALYQALISNEPN